LAWAAAVCLVVGWVATRGAAASQARQVARGTASALAAGGDAAGPALTAQVEALEERLLADRARVRFWRELQARHEGVTAVTCANLAAHADAMARADVRRVPAEPRRRRLAVAKLEHHSN
jgi:hypothetical protein